MGCNLESRPVDTRICEALVGDETGSIYLTLWDEAVEGVSEEQILRIPNGYVNLFRGSMLLNLGCYGSYMVEYEASFEEVNLDNNLSNRQFERATYDPRRCRGRDRYDGRSRRRY